MIHLGPAREGHVAILTNPAFRQGIFAIETSIWGVRRKVLELSRKDLPHDYEEEASWFVSDIHEAKILLDVHLRPFALKEGFYQTDIDIAAIAARCQTVLEEKKLLSAAENRIEQTFDALRHVRPVFTAWELSLMANLPEQTAVEMCEAFEAQKLIERAGPGSDIFINLLKPERDCIKFVMAKAYGPFHVVIGASALNQGGFTTQRSHLFELAIPGDVEAISISRVRPIHRSPEWFEAVRAHVDDGISGVPVLAPEFALIDSIISRQLGTNGGKGETVWHVDPDDVSFFGDDEKEIVARCHAAALALGADMAFVKSYLDEVPELVGYIDDVDLDWGSRELRR